MTGESADAVTDWSLFPTGDECLVAIQAFYKAKFGVSVPVARNAWTGGCGPTGACHIWVDDIPNSATWERIANDGSHTPAPYDMIVYPPIPGDVYGHIASVDHVQGTSIYVMDDNYCNNDCQRKAPAPHTVSWKAYGWYHLRSLPGGGSSGGGGSCPSGDGLYCGGNGVSGDPGTLYACGGGKLATSQVCPHGCQKMSAGTNDQCAAAPSGPSPASCPSGDGLYCGGNGVSGDASTLYQCTGGKLTAAQACAHGCQKMPAGTNDQCAAAPSGPSPASCPSGDGLYCGGNGVSGDASTLYQCTGGNLTVAQSCSNGCQKMPAGTNDQCAAPPPPPPSCPSGNGLYCGNDGVGGDSNTLYQCTGGSLSPVSLCAQGCTTMPAGTNDQCASSSCPSGDGLYCGGDTIIGSTSTLYRCAAGVLTVAQACANGCAAMAAGTNDACR
ncbi:MAG TPA: CHAP domain-containing protein [Polyangiaceae bacterium]|nr:CHAP domain-containing protein [Polyangiaceae bacterium]